MWQSFPLRNLAIMQQSVKETKTMLFHLNVVRPLAFLYMLTILTSVHFGMLWGELYWSKPSLVHNMGKEVYPLSTILGEKNLYLLFIQSEVNQNQY